MMRVMMMAMAMMMVMMMIDDDHSDVDYEDESTSVIYLHPLSLSQVSGSRQTGIRTRGEIIIPHLFIYPSINSSVCLT